jgi:glycosyltransferase involved in cell wall biosynthesis
MDGLEWKRTKYGKSTQKFLKFAEKLAVKKSDFLISDSLGIKNYLENEYRVDSTYIPYGAWVFDQPNNEVLSKYNLKPYAYDMLIARLEPENSIEIILEGFANAKTERVFVVIGNNKTNYGNFLTEKFSSQKNIIFLGSIYEMDTVNNLRYFSNLYFHGHTVGGTNPSLLEAMASNALIAANKNDFNEAILENEAYYFNTPEEVSSIVETVIKNPTEEVKLELNIIKIRTLYSWNIIIEKYEKLFLTALQNKK